MSNELQKKQDVSTQQARMQLAMLKASTKKLVRVHNETILLLWDVTQQLKEFQRELAKSESNSSHANRLQRGINELNYRKKILDDTLEHRDVANKISEQMAEIQRLENDISG